MRIAPAMITELKDNEIFVFGSNLSGRHGAGAALYAKEHFGAEHGIAEGLQGKSYGIPTRNEYIETLPIDKIKVYVDNFTSFAKLHPELTLLVTEIGCGRANYKPDPIAILFKEASEVMNVYLPESFWAVLNK